jgi:hypothetical protein
MMEVKSQPKLIAWAGVSIILASAITILSHSIELFWQMPTARAKLMEAEAALATPPAMIESARFSHYSEVVMTDALLKPVADAGKRIALINRRLAEIESEAKHGIVLKTGVPLTANVQLEREREKAALLREKSLLLDEIRRDIDESRAVLKYVASSGLGMLQEIYNEAMPSVKIAVDNAAKSIQGEVPTRVPEPKPLLGIPLENADMYRVRQRFGEISKEAEKQ